MAIQIRRGTNSQWESNKSNIVAGEPAITTDTGRLFVGTGAGTYAEFTNPTQDQYTDIAKNANLVAIANKSGTVTNYYVEYTVNNDLVSAFALKADTTYTLTATITSSVSGFYIDVGCGNGAYLRTIANTTRSSSGNVYTITFTPSSADLAVGSIFAIRMPRYGTSQTFTYSVSNASLTYGTVSDLTLTDVLLDLADNCNYKSGEIIKLQGGTIAGMITGGSTLVAMTVCVDKSMKNISSITVSKCTGAIRGGSGYVNGSTNDTNWLTASGITVGANKMTERSVYLWISSTTALTNVTNNSPIVLNCNPLQLTFN